MIPSEREQELVAMFDSFCKAVIRNYSRTLIRRKSNRPENLDDHGRQYILLHPLQYFP